MQRAPEVAVALGANRDYAALLARVFLADVYPYQPAAYRSPECKDGGRLDLAPRESAWP